MIHAIRTNTEVERSRFFTHLSTLLVLRSLFCKRRDGVGTAESAHHLKWVYEVDCLSGRLGGIEDLFRYVQWSSMVSDGGREFRWLQ